MSNIAKSVVLHESENLPDHSDADARIRYKTVAKLGRYLLEMVRFERGARHSAHSHKDPEYVCLLEGELHDGFRALRAPCVVEYPAGSVHQIRSESGATWLLLYTGEENLVPVANLPTAPPDPQPRVIEDNAPRTAMKPGISSNHVTDPDIGPGRPDGGRPEMANYRLSWVKFDPGTAYPCHEHIDTEFMCVVDGEFTDGHRALRRNALVEYPPGSTHALRTEAGGSFLIVRTGSSGIRAVDRLVP